MSKLPLHSTTDVPIFGQLNLPVYADELYPNEIIRIRIGWYYEEVDGSNDPGLMVTIGFTDNTGRCYGHSFAPVGTPEEMSVIAFRGFSYLDVDGDGAGFYYWCIFEVNAYQSYVKSCGTTDNRASHNIRITAGWEYEFAHDTEIDVSVDYKNEHISDTFVVSDYTDFAPPTELVTKVKWSPSAGAIAFD